MTTEQCYKDFLDELEKIYEKNEAANISDWVFENVTGQKRFERHLSKNEDVSNDNVKQLQKYLSELLTHKPVQYVLSEAWFYKMKFYVNEYVLIPRPETEELVQWIVDDMQNLKRPTQLQLQILDIGTGSACISISLKKNLNNAEITAVDISSEALSVAEKNASLQKTEINFLQVDFLDETNWDAYGNYDVIVSNPPYIPANEKERLARNVIEFEPAIALFVPENDPFIFYEKIVKFARTHLSTNGHVYVEFHENYPDEVQQIFMNNNFKPEVKTDMYGKARMIKASVL
jgi:release factor glutamine methyltransferase